MSFAVLFMLVMVMLFPLMVHCGVSMMVGELSRVGHTFRIVSYGGTITSIMADDFNVSYRVNYITYYV